MPTILLRTLFQPASKNVKGETTIFSRLRSQPSILLGLLPPLLAAAALKAWLVSAGAVPFNADEAVVGLMARHILQGARPMFFYGQAYMGSLDAWLIAGGFALFGQEVWVIRLVQVLLYTLTLASTAWLGRMALGSWRVGIAAAWLLAIPAVNVTLYTTASLGGYGEALLIGNLILIQGLHIVENRNVGAHGHAPLRIIRDRDLPEGNRSILPLLAWGFLTGLGLWSFGLTLVYSLPMGAILAWHLIGRDRSLTKFASILAGLLFGSAPWWGYALQHGFGPLILELQGGNIAGVEKLPLLWMAGQHLASLLLLGSSVIFGLRPPWEIRWLALPLLPFVLVFWLSTLAYSIKKLRRELSTISDQRLAISDQAPAVGQPPSASSDQRPAIGDQPPATRNPRFAIREPRSSTGRLALIGVMITLSLGFILTPFGADPSGRYFIPLAVPLALFAADLVLDLGHKIGRWNWGLVALVMGFNFWGTLQCVLSPPGLTTQFNAITQLDWGTGDELISFLKEHEATRGYTNYWVAYPLAFLSQEELIFIPRLPYHQDFRYTPRDDRFAPYDEVVEQSGRTAIITTRHPDLDEKLRLQLSQLGIAWDESQIGDFQVFYDLSEKVTLDPSSITFIDGGGTADP